MSIKTKALFSVILSAFLNGPTGAVSKIGLHQFPPISYAFLRFFIAAICIVIIFQKGLALRHFFRIAPLSLLATVNIIFFVIGINLTTATIGILLYAAVPFLTGLTAFVLFKEKLSDKKIAGIIIGFMGTVGLVVLPLLEKKQKFSGNLVGNIFIILAVLSWSLYMVFSKKYLTKYSPFEIVSNFIFVTFLSLLPFFFIDATTHNFWWKNVTWSGILSLVYVSLVATIGAYIINQYAIKHGGSVFASTTFYLTPIVGYLSAFLLLGEKLTVGLLLGGLVSLTGTYLVLHN